MEEPSWGRVGSCRASTRVGGGSLPCSAGRGSRAPRAAIPAALPSTVQSAHLDFLSVHSGLFVGQREGDNSLRQVARRAGRQLGAQRVCAGRVRRADEAAWARGRQGGAMRTAQAVGGQARVAGALQAPQQASVSMLKCQSAPSMLMTARCRSGSVSPPNSRLRPAAYASGPPAAAWPSAVVLV